MARRCFDAGFWPFDEDSRVVDRVLAQVAGNLLVPKETTGRHGTARHGTVRHDTTRHDTVEWGAQLTSELNRRRVGAANGRSTRSRLWLTNVVMMV